MHTPPVALDEEDYNAGAHQWLASRVLRAITAGLGLAAAAAWLLGVVVSVASWRDDTVLLPAGVVLSIAVLTAVPALLWLAGVLFRTTRPAASLTSTDPFSPQNRTVTAVLFGIVRPTRWTLAGSLIVVAASATALVMNARLGAHQVEFRVINGVQQSRALRASAWSYSSVDGYRAERAADLRSSAAAILLADTVAMMAMVGLFRWSAAESNVVDRSPQASRTTPTRRGPRLVAKKRFL